MQANSEPEQAFSISMPQPVFEISIAYIKTLNWKKHALNIQLPRILLLSFSESLFLHMFFKFHSDIYICVNYELSARARELIISKNVPKTSACVCLCYYAFAYILGFYGKRV